MDIRQNLATGLKLPAQLNSLSAGAGFGKNKSGEDDGGRQDAGKAAFYVVLLRTRLQEADSDPQSTLLARCPLVTLKDVS